MKTPFDLIQALSGWFFRRGEAIFTGGKDIDTGGGDIIVGAGTVDGVNLTTHVADTDAHHNESHTVASHSDTTATGSELNTLTDGSDASSLHDHDGRYFQESEFSSNPGANSKPLESTSSGTLTLESLTVAGTGTSVDSNGSVKIGLNGVLILVERSTPGTPASGTSYLYTKTDGKLYFKNDAGTETALT